MQRRHFQAIADVLRVHRSDMSSDVHALLCLSMADQLGRFNPNFQSGRFLDACEAKQ